MPIKYVDEKTMEFIEGSLKDTGAPSRYGIDTPEKLVSMSMSMSPQASENIDIFFPQKESLWT